jgi:UDPglucose--hexose-1-phosphate uridylyltransferase
MSELRWNPMLAEWVATGERDRSAIATADVCPLCPTRPGGPRTAIAESAYDVAVVESPFAALHPEPEPPGVEGTSLFAVRPARGVCELVAYTSNHASSLAVEPVEQSYKLVRVWADRFDELGSLDFVKYVFTFENGGARDHPHAEIHAYPFVPPVIARELEAARQYEDSHGRCLLCDLVAEERHAARRIVTENASFAAYIPFFARCPYEVHVTPVRHVQSVVEMDDVEHRDLAAVLKAVLAGFDALADGPSPYTLSIHQRPTDGHRYDYYHLHIELYPALRSATRTSPRAASETGAGFFVNDIPPEATAEELRVVVPDARWPA